MVINVSNSTLPLRLFYVCKTPHNFLISVFPFFLPNMNDSDEENPFEEDAHLDRNNKAVQQIQLEQQQGLEPPEPNATFPSPA